MDKEGIFAKVERGERITAGEALEIYRSASLLEIGRVADRVRWRKHPVPIVTFVVDRNVNYTNVCTVNCRFCAFYRPPSSPEGYILPAEEILKKVEGLVKIGGTQVLLQGGLNPNITLDDVAAMLIAVRDRYPMVDLHSFTTTEIDYYARKGNLPVKEVLIRLKEAGLKSLPGGGAEILVDRVRSYVSPLKNPASSWLEIMETAQNLHMPTTATMVFGMVESIEERLEHLSKIRDLQDRTHGFTAFIPWSFEPENTALRHLKRSTSTEYLRMIALSRIFLDNFDNIQSGWVTEGRRIAQMALRFGANDFGGILMEEHVVSAAGRSYYMDIDLAVSTIRDGGFVPAQRDTYYNILRVF